MTDRISQINAKAAAVKNAAASIDTSRTETVTVADLKPGDIITRLGNVTFPFPFTLTKTQKIGSFGYTLAASHGWFAPMVKSGDTATRVI